MPSYKCNSWKNLSFGLSLLGLIFSSQLLAASSNPNERDYHIEVLIFAQKPGAETTELPGPAKAFGPVTSPALVLGKAPAWQLLLSPEASIATPKPTAIKLERQARALERDSNYRVLAHEAWVMHLVGADRSWPVLIEGGDYYAKQPELQGRLFLHVGRYLHLETDVFLHTFTKLEEALNPNLNKAYSKLEKTEIRSKSSVYDGNYQIKASAGMHQKRRMRSGELHFIDSPYMGMLIQISRLDK